MNSIQLKQKALKNYKKLVILGLKDNRSDMLIDLIDSLIKKVKEAKSFNQIYHVFDNTIFEADETKILMLISILSCLGIKIKD